LTFACLIPSSNALNAASTPSDADCVSAGGLACVFAGVSAGAFERFVFVFCVRSVVVDEFEF